MPPPEVIAVGSMSLAEGVSLARRVDPQRINCKFTEAVLAWFGGYALFAPPQKIQT